MKQEDWNYPPSPGLVLEWRRHSYKWWAYVSFVEERTGSAPTTIQCWLPAERLIPVKSDPNKGGRSMIFLTSVVLNRYALGEVGDARNMHRGKHGSDVLGYVAKQDVLHHVSCDDCGRADIRMGSEST